MKLYKQKNGKTWSMRFVFEGQRIEQSTGHTNLRKAEAFAEALRTKLRNEGAGILEKRPVPSFTRAMADFLEWCGLRQKKSTASRYEIASKALIAYFGKVAHLDRITKPQIEKFITWRKSQYGAPRGVKPKNGKSKQTKRKKISNATVNRELACLKKMFSNLVADGILTTNPVKLVKFLQEDSEPGRVLNWEEERLYLIAASQPLQDYATVLVETGLRPDELCRLAVRDIFVDVDRPYLIVKDGKTKAARRTVPLSTRALAVLKRRIANATGKYIFAGGRGGNDPNNPAVKFNNAHYGTLRRSKIDRVNRTGTDGICTLYSFRHTFATRFLERRPGDLLTLAALLGHSSLRMVMRYAHPSDEHKFEAIRSMEEDRPKQRKGKKQADKCTGLR
jgi:integrase